VQLINDIPVWGSPIDEGAMSQIRTCAKTADKVALMADHHKGYAVPIGGVVAYENAISPSGVGFDIACGNKAVLTDAPADEVRRNISRIMDDVFRTISFGIGRNNSEKVEHPIFDKDHAGWRAAPEIAALKRMAENQLGTVGSGNHYVDIFTDEQDRVWIGVHFGSRGLGHKTATHFLKAAGAKDGMDVEPCVIPVDSQLGQDYLAGMALAGEYAYAGRDWVCARSREDSRHNGAGGGPQPPQLRLARTPWRPRSVGCSQGRHAGVSRAERFRRRIDGRYLGHHRGRRK